MFGQKNFAGTFAPPHAVVNDLSFLSTLPHSMLLDGIAEAIKVAIIKDIELFKYIHRNTAQIAQGEMEVIERIIIQSAKLHSSHIAHGGDPFELGSARPLDFGHWAAHKLELISDHSLRHGESVAIGLALDSVYAHLICMISEPELKQILRTIYGCGMQIFSPLLTQNNFEIIEGIEQFREHLGGELTITLPKGIGAKIEINEIKRELIIRAINTLQQFSLSGELD